MPSSHSTDPTSLAPETTPPSDEAPAMRKDVGSPQEVLAPVNALKGSIAERLDDPPERANQLARQPGAVLHNARTPGEVATTTDLSGNQSNGDDRASATVQVYAAALTKLQKRFDSLVFEHTETRRERDELTRQLVAATSAPAEAESRTAEMERSLHSIRQARDTVLAHNVALTEKLTAAERRISELEYELEHAQRARDAAPTRSRDLSETGDEPRQKTLELTREREQLREQFTGPTDAFSDRCAGDNSATSNDANCEAAPLSTAGPLNPSDTNVLLAAMQACLELLTDDAGNREILDKLQHHFHSFGERARTEGCVALDRLSAACEQLTGWLEKTPGKIAESIEPLANAVRLLGEIATIDEPQRIADPAEALVYSVDDDVDNCECLTTAMEKSALHARYATKSEIALSDLTAGPCDLIILDVDLPEMNGFDLFALVRALGHHEKTPVIFLGGAPGGEARAAELRDNAHVFVPKPYNLNTLGLIALCAILKSRLGALMEKPTQDRNARRPRRVKG
jgi:CheY-like chemotaxis protein